MTVGNAFVCPREGGFALQRRAWGSSDAGAARHGDSLHGRREGMGSEAVLGGTQLVTDPGDRWEQAYFSLPGCARTPDVWVCLPLFLPVSEGVRHTQLCLGCCLLP